MIKEALQYLIGLGEAKTSEIILPDGVKGVYSDKPMYRLETPVWTAERIYLHTLTGFVDYIKSKADKMAERMIIEVQSPTNIFLYSQLGEKREREYLIQADALVPEFDFGRFYGQEEFCIALQSKFIASEERELLLKFAGTVENGTIAQYGDDGVTQKATIKTGLASKGEALIPNPVTLKPFRTFLEVDQPGSMFIFRMKEVGGNVGCALFEADGGAWKMGAMQNIKAYLENALANEDGFTVIA